MGRAILLLSGGLDSVVSTGLARREHEVVLALTFDYGQRAASREIAAAQRFSARWEIAHRVESLPWLAAITDSALVNTAAPLPHYDVAGLDDLVLQRASATAVWVPNRNGIFINIAAAFAEAMSVDRIVTGFNAEEAATFPDNTAAFVERTNAYLEYATLCKPRVVSYTQAMTKHAIVDTARRLDIPLDWCWPCYEGGKQWCGKCESCVRFLRAMER